MEIEKKVLLLVDDVLALDGRALEFTASTPLLGAVPELDSMAVIGIINAIEEQFDFIIGDDEIDGGTFETVGSLVDFVRHKQMN
ncbi:acyl carrier protein [Cognatazoarcus halotolerans]|uniref:acyl carrier protein n=1 Tax=Cognatazoarcus halotolerans TaxID=2686016 RepID=UPI0013569CFA|nr:phosphopantetheine-binding protein [Cognatazoarcus halotolerans]MCB1901336.1 acyl carrier protein [Rhodocyclaceae bacterium]MCP5311623.1 acyl carrier protein [Zoogloeaceae bacterium]